jgi:hypothetical protein
MLDFITFHIHMREYFRTAPQALPWQHQYARSTQASGNTPMTVPLWRHHPPNPPAHDHSPPALLQQKRRDYQLLENKDSWISYCHTGNRDVLCPRPRRTRNCYPNSCFLSLPMHSLGPPWQQRWPLYGEHSGGLTTTVMATVTITGYLF